MLRLFSVLVAIFPLFCPPLSHAQANGDFGIHLLDVKQRNGGILIPFGAGVAAFNNDLMKQCDNPVSSLQQLGITRADYNFTSLDYADKNSSTSHILLVTAANFTFTTERAEHESGDAILTWDPNTDVVAGYKVYFGTVSRIYGSPIDVGNQTSYTVTGLDYGVKYYFAVTAYDFDGIESGYSKEVSKTIGSALTQLTMPLAGSSGTTAASLGQDSIMTACGWITATTVTQPAALANFGFTQNGVLSTEVGVAASTPTTAARLFVDYSPAGGTNSGVAMANPSSSPITVSVQLNNAQGDVTTCPNQTVPAKGHLAMFASQLCPNITNPFLGTLTLTSSMPFVATTLLSGANSHGEALYNSLPVATPGVPPTNSSLYFSQFADGGGFSTEVLLMNLTGTAITGRVSFFGDNAQPATLNFGGSIGSVNTLNYSIPGNGMQKFISTGSTLGTPLKAGFVVVASTGGALPSGAVIFSQNNATGGLASQADVLNSPVTTSSRMYVEKSSSPLTRNTGVAIVNPNASAATVQLNLVSLDGSFTASNTIALAANNHMAGFIDQSGVMGAAASSVPANFQGVLTLSSNLPIAPVTLRLTTNQRGENLYSTLPVVDLNNPPPGPLYLPQIADGGGFTTQIILINTGGSTGTITINFYDDVGSKVQIRFSSEVAPKIAGGGGHSLALRKDGTVRACWNCYNGQLGNGTIIHSRVPVLGF